MSRIYDAVVMGGGLAGLTAAIFLKKAGLDVVCVEPRFDKEDAVGESLDWVCPRLFASLGISTDKLMAQGRATPKAKIIVTSLARRKFKIPTPQFLKYWPLKMETVTIHVERRDLNAMVLDRAKARKVELIEGKVRKLAHSRGQIESCTLDDGRVLRGRWFVDATSRARILARTLGVPRTVYGKRKVVIFGHFTDAANSGGTSFYLDNSEDYLSWVWEIPITPEKLSIGFVSDSDTFKALREKGDTPEDMMTRRFGWFDRFGEDYMKKCVNGPFTLTYENYTHEQVCGDNWFMIGEAASMVDPITSNGASAAMREARFAANTIAGVLKGKLATPKAVAREKEIFTRLVHLLSRSFNYNVERTIYEPTIRRHLCLPCGVAAYATFGFFFNALVTRIGVRSMLKQRVLKAIVTLFNGYVWLWVRWGEWRMRRAGLPRRVITRRVAPLERS